MGIWHYVAISFDVNDAIKFYINGKLDTQHSSPGPTQTNRFPLRFGRAANGE
jgi:hypothetical protein